MIDHIIISRLAKGNFKQKFIDDDKALNVSISNSSCYGCRNRENVPIVWKCAPAHPVCSTTVTLIANTRAPPFPRWWSFWVAWPSPKVLLYQVWMSNVVLNDHRFFLCHDYSWLFLEPCWHSCHSFHSPRWWKKDGFTSDNRHRSEFTTSMVSSAFCKHSTAIFFF